LERSIDGRIVGSMLVSGVIGIVLGDGVSHRTVEVPVSAAASGCFDGFVIGVVAGPAVEGCSGATELFTAAFDGSAALDPCASCFVEVGNWMVMMGLDGNRILEPMCVAYVAE